MLPLLKKAFLLIGISIFLVILFLPGFTRLQELKDRNHNLEAEIRRLDIENELLEEELKRVEKDPVYQERIAREKMGVVRKGEIPVKIITEEE